MNTVRRAFLKGAGGAAAAATLLAAGLLKPLRALAAYNSAAFTAKTLNPALQHLGAAGAQPSNAIVIQAPEIAENGARVPIQVTSHIPGTESISVLADGNPFPLIGTFHFANGTEPYAAVQIKLAKTTNVRVIAKARGRAYIASREVKVTLGGCGG
jgi:sulfur-oxidizing protein SoxY